MTKVIRPDFILSYWVFMWYVAYMLRLTPASPKLLLQIGVIENIWTMWYIWGYATTENFIYFIVVFILTKIIPVATIWNVPITKRDVVWSVVLLVVYSLWIYINRNQMTISTIQSLRENRNETPGIWVFHTLKKLVNCC